MKENFVFIKTLSEARKAIERAYEGCYPDIKYINAFLSKQEIPIADDECPQFICANYGQKNQVVTIFNDFEASEKCATDAMRKYLTLKYGEAYIDALKDYIARPLEKLLQEREQE